MSILKNIQRKRNYFSSIHVFCSSIYFPQPINIVEIYGWSINWYATTPATGMWDSASVLVRILVWMWTERSPYGSMEIRSASTEIMQLKLFWHMFPPMSEYGNQCLIANCQLIHTTINGAYNIVSQPIGNAPCSRLSKFHGIEFTTFPRILTSAFPIAHICFRFEHESAAPLQNIT